VAPKKNYVGAKILSPKKQDKTPNLREALRNPFFGGCPFTHLFPHFFWENLAKGVKQFSTKTVRMVVKNDQKFPSIFHSAPPDHPFSTRTGRSRYVCPMLSEINTA